MTVRLTTFEMHLNTLTEGKKQKKKSKKIKIQNMEHFRLEYKGKEVSNESSKMKFDILVTIKTRKKKIDLKKNQR